MALHLRHDDRRARHDQGRGSARLPLAVAAVALLGLGVWIGRESQPPPDPGAPEADVPSVSVEAAAPVGWPGPTAIRDGVPVGYARTRAGAVAAAVNYDRTWAGAYGDRLSEVLDVIAAADARDDLRAGMQAAAAATIQGLGLDPSDDAFAGRVAYGGYAVDSFGWDAATVRLWSAGHMVDPRMGGLDAGWVTTTVTLQWERGDWRLVDFRTADGPAAAEANTGDPRRVGRAMNEFEEFWHVPR